MSYIFPASNVLIDLLLKEANNLMKKEMDPVVAASNVYKFLNENDRVRVLEVVFKPGDVAKMHHHPEHVVYALKGGTGRFTSGGKTQEMEIKTGSVIFLEAQDHEVKNIGNTTLDLIVMELKK
jgi:beta-alanine degradation protein BauB